MSEKDKERSQWRRPACMPSNQQDGVLPPISHRGTPSSDSDVDCRRSSQLSSNENSSLSSSPVKLPTIGRSFSTSVSSLTTGQSKDRTDKREILCRSPSCPSNIGLVHETLDKQDKQNKERPVLEDDDVRLPSIFQERKPSVSNYLTPRNTRHRSNSRTLTSSRSCDHGLTSSRSRDQSLTSGRSRDQSTEGDGSYRSATQCALLLPLRNSETRKSKRKRRRQNTRLGGKPDEEKTGSSSRSEYTAYSPVRELGARMLSESDDLHSDVSSDGNNVRPTFPLTQHSNQHQIRMKDLGHVKA